MRTANHIAGNSAKGHALKTMIRTEFRKNAAVTDEDKIEELKFAAVRGMSNYLLLVASTKEDDEKLGLPLSRQQRSGEAEPGP